MNEEKIKEMKAEILKHRAKLRIDRLPEEIKQKFCAFAHEHFCEDYGMTLKWAFEQALEYQEIKKILFGDKSAKSINK